MSIVVLTPFLNVKCLYRSADECSRRGTTNQSESQDHDVMLLGRNLFVVDGGDVV